MPEFMRFAVATKEGLAISEHFGHARQFAIYDVSSHHCQFVERREVKHYCLGGHSDKSAMPAILDAISDCCAVFVAKIGEAPANKLGLKGIKSVPDYAWEEIEPSLRDYFCKQADTNKDIDSSEQTFP